MRDLPSQYHKFIGITQQQCAGKEIQHLPVCIVNLQPEVEAGFAVARLDQFRYSMKPTNEESKTRSERNSLSPSLRVGTGKFVWASFCQVWK